MMNFADTNWNNAPWEILGLGVEGRSTLAWLRARGENSIIVRDRTDPGDLPDGVRGVFGDAHLTGIDPTATVFRSPGIRPDIPALTTHRSAGGKVVTQTSVFLKEWRVLGGRSVAVTGTMGKGSVCQILHAMLLEAGRNPLLGGNIGIPLLDLLGQCEPDRPAVLELSSFQLSDLAPPTQGPDIAVFGPVTTEHLDWHRDVGEYWDAKGNLARILAPGALAIFRLDDEGSTWCASQGPAKTVGVCGPGGIRVEEGRLLDVDGRILTQGADLPVRGAWHLTNVALAWTAARLLGISDEACHRAVACFKGLPHRQEVVFSEECGIMWVNDSYATRPDATLAAVEAWGPHPLALILGGSDKGADFGPLADALDAALHLVHVALIGATAERLAAVLSTRGIGRRLKIVTHSGLAEAMDSCREALGQGPGTVLLSPACASFGLFRDYRERGETFTRLVRERVIMNR